MKTIFMPTSIQINTTNRASFKTRIAKKVTSFTDSILSSFNFPSDFDFATNDMLEDIIGDLESRYLEES